METTEDIKYSHLADAWAREATMSGEMAEGVAAFRERRAPEFPWRGRAH